VCLAMGTPGDTPRCGGQPAGRQATTFEGADTFSRNCQSAEGEQVYLQSKRQVGVPDPKVRRVLKAQQAASK